jgi:hypothetical protein
MSQERISEMKKLLLTTSCLLVLGGHAYAADKLNAPFPKLQYGQKLCMSNIPPGDPFYKECQACEKTGSCNGDLRDRMRKSPYGDPDSLMVAATSEDNANFAVIFTKKPRKEAIAEVLKECSADGKYVCREDREFNPQVFSYKGRPGRKSTDIELDVDKNTCIYFARSKEPTYSDSKQPPVEKGYWSFQGPTPKDVAECTDKHNVRHKCTTPVGMCTGK